MKKHELSDESKAAKKAEKAFAAAHRGRGKAAAEKPMAKAAKEGRYRGGMGKGEPARKPKAKGALTSGNLDVGKTESGLHTGSLSKDDKALRTGTLILSSLKVGDVVTDKDGQRWTVTKRTD